MIDIHSHILFGVDDGAKTIEDSMAIARGELQGGTHAFIATPHVIDGRDFDRLEEFEAARQAVIGRFAQEGIPVQVHSGAEVYPNMKAAKALDEGKIGLTLCSSGRYMLVDTPLTGVSNDLETFLFEVQARGITPILAHPERAVLFNNSPEKLDEFIEKGMACQINASSLKGRYGPVAADLARRFLQRRLAHFVAGDIHRPHDYPVLGSFASAPPEGLDSDYVRLLTQDSAACVVAGKPLPPLPPAPPEPAAKKGFFGRLLGR